MMNDEKVNAIESQIDKIKRYSWKVIDRPGRLEYIPKTALEVDPTYQRTHGIDKVRDLASKWSWIACGALTVSERPDGKYYVIDGQHRTLAALKRSDISVLPCVVFTNCKIEDEAAGFVNANSNRGLVSTIAKYRANLVAKEPLAVYLEETFSKYGIQVSKNSTGAVHISCIGGCCRMATLDKNKFESVLSIARMVENPKTKTISEEIIEGLFYIARAGNIDITERRFSERVVDIGSVQLMRSIGDAKVYHGKSGGESMSAIGIVNAVNKKLKHKYVLLAAPK